jgi:hypothetical protein
MERPPFRHLILATAALLAACAAPAAKAENSGKSSFLWLRNIDGFNSIDDEHIVLSAGTRKALVKTFGWCDGLRFAETIAIDAPLDYLDKQGVGHIVYRRGPHDQARCPIDTIVAVESVKEAKEIVAAEKAEKAKAKEAKEAKEEKS